MSDLALTTEDIALPPGAHARTHRARLMQGRTTLLGLTQGDFRAFLHPVSTPAGFCVTAERPADHPHHSGIWIAADHVHLQVPGALGRIEEYTYNFYVDDIFQGRAPGRILARSERGTPERDGGFLIEQTLDWIGPAEWGAPAGRPVLRETRTTRLRPLPGAFRIDLHTALQPAGHAVTLGPTRHALFNLRAADSMTAVNGGRITCDRGRTGGDAVSGEGARWVDLTGPVGGGHVAGLTLIPETLAGRPPYWFAADWGVLTVGPFRLGALRLEPGESLTLGCTVLAHDGPPDRTMIETIAREQG
jgi:hypothetical protein